MTDKRIPVKPADILVPDKSISLEKWAVVACDQYTSEPDYWESVEDYVGKSPSTYNLILPECYLEETGLDGKIEKIHSTMNKYYEQGVFKTYKDCFFLTERTTAGKTRTGLLATIDLEYYDYNAGSESKIRATEGTILSRIPVRKKIRSGASLEFPHILVLISDKEKSVIEPLSARKSEFEKVYDFELMKEGGHVCSYCISSENDKKAIISSFEKLFSSSGDKSIQFAIGDGNHSLAAAKSCWEEIKNSLDTEERENHPARFCLIEIENIFDEGITFEPINRVLFDVCEDKFLSLLKRYADGIEFETVMCKHCIAKRNLDQTVQGFGYCTENKHVYVRIKKPQFNIAAGTVQKIIDDLVAEGIKVDYVHGIDIADELGSKRGNIGISLPAISKDSFFDSIEKEGVLPRKTFSMGNANEKRFYIEGKKIK